MNCIDCNFATVEDSKKGTYFYCAKLRKKIDRPFRRCMDKKANLKDKHIDLYMRLYKKYTTKQIADKFGWSYNRLYAFIQNNLLPI
jgi:hypothetical protein